MAQTQYRNMDKGCEGILQQGKGLHNSQVRLVFNENILKIQICLDAAFINFMCIS